MVPNWQNIINAIKEKAQYKKETWMNQLQNFGIDMECIRQGWRLSPPGSSQEEIQQAIEVYLAGGQPTWYPPNYVPPDPIITEGKLQIDYEKQSE